MISEAPPFWWSEKAWQGAALSPLGWAYGRVARWRMERAPRVPVDAPVICVGNFTVGGAGKTPTALALGVAALERGLRPGFLSRGHGGRSESPVLVEPGRHGAGEVGDEPLLLARCAATVVARDRLAGASRLIAEGVDLIVMDDGFQSARLHFDYALLVVDARRGLGNCRLIPAGPVRAPVLDQMRHASALVRIGEGEAADPVVRLAARAAKPIQRARLVPRGAEGLAGRPVLAFAAIGDPDKFFATVRGVGADLRLSRAFPDHHVFSEEDAVDLLDTARKDGLTLVTTAKDMARLGGAHGSAAELSKVAEVISVELVFSEPSAPDQIIDAAMAAFSKRRRS